MAANLLPNASEATTPEWLQLVRGKVESLRYGVVQIVVHDNQVTQIERTEKTRFDSAKHELLRPHTSI
ncbi:MAG: YezD family protein [Nibricoccus sp.]